MKLYCDVCAANKGLTADASSALRDFDSKFPEDKPMTKEEALQFFKDKGLLK